LTESEATLSQGMFLFYSFLFGDIRYGWCKRESSDDKGDG
jgi:hypothetical protein